MSEHYFIPTPGMEGLILIHDKGLIRFDHYNLTGRGVEIRDFTANCGMRAVYYWYILDQLPEKYRKPAVKAIEEFLRYLSYGVIVSSDGRTGLTAQFLRKYGEDYQEIGPFQNPRYPAGHTMVLFVKNIVDVPIRSWVLTQEQAPKSNNSRSVAIEPIPAFNWNEYEDRLGR